MERKVPFEVGERYHIYTRGVDRRIIFDTAKDSERFLTLLFLCNDKKPVKFSNIPISQRGLPSLVGRKRERIADIEAYALMPNHVHLIVRERVENGISEFMQRLLTAYSMYFNTKNERSGPLFTRPFRSKHVDSDEYFRWLFAYVHLNPLDMHQKDWQAVGLRDRNSARNFLKTYRYSSFMDYSGPTRQERNIIEYSDTAPPRDFDEMLEILAADVNDSTQTTAAMSTTLV